MARVVVKNMNKEVSEASESCPVSAFKKSASDEFVIDSEVCIDCGICQTIAPEGSILSDDEADETDKVFNNEKAKEWE